MLTSSLLQTSVLTQIAVPPVFCISSTTSSNLSVRLAPMATRAPASARALAIALPMPLEAPVTIATLLSRGWGPEDINNHCMLIIIVNYYINGSI